MTKKKLNPDRYQATFYKIVPTIIFSLAGASFLTLPPEILSGIGFRLGDNPENAIIFGVVFLIIASIFWYINNRKK